MRNQLFKCSVLTVFLTVITKSAAQNLVKTLSNHIVPDESHNEVILDNNRNSFSAVLKEMDEALNIEYTPCSLYQPKKPFLKVKGRRVSEIKCLKHIWDVKVEEETKRKMDLCQATSGQQLFGIVGGRKSKVGEFPHMGALGWKSEEKGKYAFKCGSFLVSERFALTAAHCQYDQYMKHPTIVRFGVINISNEKIDPHHPPQDIKILKFIKHPSYKHLYKANDIAAIHLAKRVIFNDYVQPACILNQEVNQAIISGWGSTSRGENGDGKMFEELQKAQVDVLPRETCKSKWSKKHDRIYWPKFLDSQMCAIKTTGEVADICAGDSGGPLQSVLNVKTNRTIYNVIGVTSMSVFCGSLYFPGIFTKVSSYVDWIEQVVWPEHWTEQVMWPEHWIEQVAWPRHSETENEVVFIDNEIPKDTYEHEPSESENKIDTTNHVISQITYMYEPSEADNEIDTTDNEISQDTYEAETLGTHYETDTTDNEISQDTYEAQHLETNYETDTTDNEISQDTYKHEPSKTKEDKIVRIVDAQNYDNGIMYWFDTTHTNEWTYIDNSELKRNRQEQHVNKTDKNNTHT